MAVLQETRSPDTRTQLFSIQALTSIWNRSGGRLIGGYSAEHTQSLLRRCFSGYSVESTAYLEDLADSESDEVAREARAFSKLMKSTGGVSAQLDDA